MKISSDISWDRTSGLPICSTAPKPLCYRGPLYMHIYIYMCVCVCVCVYIYIYVVYNGWSKCLCAPNDYRKHVHRDFLITLYILVTFGNHINPEIHCGRNWIWKQVVRVVTTVLVVVNYYCEVAVTLKDQEMIVKAVCQWSSCCWYL